MSDQLHLKIARALTPPGKPVYLPTDEQRQIIEAPIEPALVVAGAGSGKTHTMVLRILWLIATKQVRPSEVLGLTFTRKATGELRTRLEAGMRALRQHGIVEFDEFEVPEISTYNSYASTIYRQYALLVGREPDAMLLDQPGAFALMRQVAIDTSDVELMLGQWSSPGQLASQALKLANALRDNGRTAPTSKTSCQRSPNGSSLANAAKHSAAELDRNLKPSASSLPTLSDCRCWRGWRMNTRPVNGNSA